MTTWQETRSTSLGDYTEADAKYSNAVTVHRSAMDIVVDFLQSQPPVDDDEMAVALVARIIMSPHQAKAMVSIVEQSLNRWTEQYGELPLLLDDDEVLESGDEAVPEAGDRGTETQDVKSEVTEGA